MKSTIDGITIAVIFYLVLYLSLFIFVLLKKSFIKYAVFYFSKGYYNILHVLLGSLTVRGHDLKKPKSEYLNHVIFAYTSSNQVIVNFLLRHWN
ncbi:uncharacterized protein OCT59_028086 [Rhizophagus irregularis]|uniref:uncharacterized protein n=1 Tax=Rhizophagus irregularis TaxID=588596 RepID=UPI003332184B|nr:hypothetical protein OCT59_028086 [Rhizophagus irregularis]